VRRFTLIRHEDVTGVSGTGFVAEGVEFSDGIVVVRWRGAHATTTVHESFASVEAIHLHGGRTSAVWLDLPTVFSEGDIDDEDAAEGSEGAPI
jgi:hypothetical protein